MQLLILRSRASKLLAEVLYWPTLRQVRRIYVLRHVRDVVSVQKIECPSCIVRFCEIRPKYIKLEKEKQMDILLVLSFSSESHGRIEILFRSIRWSLDRIFADTKKVPRTGREWELMLSFIVK